MLTCKSCGRKGRYDLGLIVINADKMKAKHSDYFQFTGYFRCKHCNAAGNWDEPKDLLMFVLSALMTQGMGGGQCRIGENRLFDGTAHKYTSDAEEHLLHKIEEDPEYAFLWNRLGNLYQGGSRPELAAVAFEKSVTIDPHQTESHYSLGILLEQAKDYEHASYHFRQMLLSCENYKEMDALKLRDLLASGLRLSFLMHIESDGVIPFIPSVEELIASGKEVSQSGSRVDMDIEVFPDDHTSFYPFAEMYLGKRRAEIPKWEQSRKPTAKKVKKKKKKRK